MDTVNIFGEQVKIAADASKELETSLHFTLEKCNEIVSYIHSAKWEGHARDAFLTYLELLMQFHKDLAKATKLQTKAVNNLQHYIANFLEDASVREVKNL
ncbi:hypothetical protein A374_18846 [Fictibacillus macauensis ZFHKF-1]|uniref:Proteins of 100 residues with WXG n=1 Tax=Fictibacillus macauensis ZFHKF-1 TaxID=1196324 RepID=I8ADV5_9BACL|nr:hypothetical protein [Fictibacillus macauensis]EIT83777.1 hypothetical protein A374_18846 [Fictibacillus macauensis ZFHKF-1]